MDTTLIVLLVANFVILAVLSARIWSLRAEMRRDTLQSYPPGGAGPAHA